MRAVRVPPVPAKIPGVGGKEGKREGGIMKNWLLPYGIWYALTAWCAVTAALSAAGGGVTGAAIGGALAAIVGLLVIRSRVRWSRSGEKALRAELIRLVDERSRTGAVAWLHRDAHLLFTADRRRIMGLPGRTLTVLDEELLRDVDDARDAGGGKVAATFTAYRAHPALARVARRTDGMTTLVTAADIEMADMADPDERERWWQRYPETARAMRAGLAFADTGELSEVLAQFRDAEPVIPDED